MSTFLELITEASSRGLSYLNDAGTGLVRLKAMVNAGRRDLCELDPWPFLETTVTGTAPLTIADLRDIVYVASANGELKGRDVSVFLADDPLLVKTGTAWYWWLDGQTTLRVWPVDASTSLTVRYLKVPADLSANGDIPSEIPARYHGLIVDFAVIHGLRDRSNYAEAQALRAGIEPEVQAMRDALLNEADEYQVLSEYMNA